MAYSLTLADRVRKHLATVPKLKVEEKTMFKGLAFLVNGKMCVNVSGETLMCRFDPALLDEVEKQKGYTPMIMRGRVYKGYCYVTSDGYKSKANFDYWMALCLEFNEKAKASKRKKPAKK